MMQKKHRWITMLLFGLLLVSFCCGTVCAADEAEKKPAGSAEKTTTGNKKKAAAPMALDGPKIGGITDGGFYNGPQTVKVTGDSEITVTVNGEPVELDENNQFTLDSDKDGECKIAAEDKDRNKTEITVTFDKTAPALESGGTIRDGGVYCKESGADITGTIKETNLDSITINGTAETSGSAGNSSYTVAIDNEPGTYTIIAQDKAGNTLEISLKVIEGHQVSSWETTIPATCTTAGEKTGKCDICGAAETEVIPADPDAHVWGDPEFVWTEYSEGMNVTVTFTCKNCSKAVTADEVTVEGTVVKNPTCEKTGEIDYTATVTFDGKVYPTNTHTIVIKPTGHDYAAVFTWAEDNKSATAVLTCRNNPDEKIAVEKEDIKIGMIERVSPKCTVAGSETYQATATAVIDSANNVKKQFSGEKTVELAATGHKYKDPVFTWSEDGKSAKATFTCENDPSHVQTETAKVTSKVKTDPTDKVKGVTTYTATVTFEDKDYTATKDVADIPVGAAQGSSSKNSSSKNSGSQTNGTSPQTGDDTAGVLWMWLLLLAGGALMVTAGKKVFGGKIL